MEEYVLSERVSCSVVNCFSTNVYTDLYISVWDTKLCIFSNIVHCRWKCISNARAGVYSYIEFKREVSK